MSNNNLVINGVSYIKQDYLAINLSSIWIGVEGTDNFTNQTIRGTASIAGQWKLVALDEYTGWHSDINNIDVEFESQGRDFLNNAIRLNEERYEASFPYLSYDCMWGEDKDPWAALINIRVIQDPYDNCYRAYFRVILEEEMYKKLHGLIIEGSVSGISLFALFLDLYVEAYDVPDRTLPIKTLEENQRPKEIAYIKVSNDPIDDSQGMINGAITKDSFNVKTNYAKFTSYQY